MEFVMHPCMDLSMMAKAPLMSKQEMKPRGQTAYIELKVLIV